jgi:hypothetical protein
MLGAAGSGPMSTLTLPLDPVPLGWAVALLRREAGGLAASALTLALVLVFAGRSTAGDWPTGREALCYWAPSLADPYAQSAWTAPLAYVYSPAFLQALEPLRALPWLTFLAAWTAVLLGAVRWLVGARLWPLGILVAAPEIAGGNIHLLLAVAIVAGFRWPAACAFALLTKVTPGVGLVWLVARGEWRHLGAALAATAAIIVASAAVDPGSWQEWWAVLAASTGHTTGTWSAIGIPLVIRLPLAVALVAWGSRTGRRWVVPVGAMLALPALWFGSLAMLLAVIPLRHRVSSPAAPGNRDAGSTEPAVRRRAHDLRPCREARLQRTIRAEVHT